MGSPLRRSDSPAALSRRSASPATPKYALLIGGLICCELLVSYEGDVDY